MTRLCKIRTFAAYRAHKLFGYNLDTIDQAIMTISRMHTHTEFQFSEYYGQESYSATMQDGYKCTRFKPIRYSHPEYWDTIRLELTPAQEAVIHAEACRLEGQPYDLAGLLSFGSPLEIIKPHKAKWWCSEIVAHLILTAGIPLRLQPDHYHPSLLDCEMRIQMDA